jgi:hypothetical protein
MEVLLVILCIVIAALALGYAALAGRGSIVFSRELMRVVAQTDERAKMHMRHADKAHDRLMAIATPNNYAAFRAESGIVEGAQYSTKQHFHDGAETSEALDRKRKLAEQATQTMNNVRESLQQEVAGRTRVPMNTALDADRNGSP